MGIETNKEFKQAVTKHGVLVIVDSLNIKTAKDSATKQYKKGDIVTNFTLGANNNEMTSIGYELVTMLHNKQIQVFEDAGLLKQEQARLQAEVLDRQMRKLSNRLRPMLDAQFKHGYLDENHIKKYVAKHATNVSYNIRESLVDSFFEDYGKPTEDK